MGSASAILCVDAFRLGVEDEAPPEREPHHHEAKAQPRDRGQLQQEQHLVHHPPVRYPMGGGGAALGDEGLVRRGQGRQGQWLRGGEQGRLGGEGGRWWGGLVHG